MTEEKKLHSALPPTIFILLAVLLWSSGGLLFKLTTVSAYEVNAGRCFLAAITIGLLTYRKGLKFNKFTFLTSLLYALTLSAFAIANKKTTAANAIFLQYTAPIYILILAPFILKEKFRVADLITVAACLGGMTLFFFDSAPNTILTPESQMQGNFFALGSGLFFGLYLLLLRHPASPKPGNLGFLRKSDCRFVNAAVYRSESVGLDDAGLRRCRVLGRFSNRLSVFSFYLRHRQGRALARRKSHRFRRTASESRLGFSLFRRTSERLGNYRRRGYYFGDTYSNAGQQQKQTRISFLIKSNFALRNYIKTLLEDMNLFYSVY